MTEQVEQKQIDISTMSTEELYKLALEQQKAVTSFFSQLQQAQTNVQALEAEIAKRGTEKAMKIPEAMKVPSKE